MKERSKMITNRLLYQLDRAFDSRFVQPNNGHFSKALKSQTEEILSQTQALTGSIQERNIKKQQKFDSKHFKGHDLEFERKH